MLLGPQGYHRTKHGRAKLNRRTPRHPAPAVMHPVRGSGGPGGRTCPLVTAALSSGFPGNDTGWPPKPPAHHRRCHKVRVPILAGPNRIRSFAAEQRRTNSPRRTLGGHSGVFFIHPPPQWRRTPGLRRPYRAVTICVTTRLPGLRPGLLVHGPSRGRSQ